MNEDRSTVWMKWFKMVKGRDPMWSEVDAFLASAPSSSEDATSAAVSPSLASNAAVAQNSSQVAVNAGAALMAQSTFQAKVIPGAQDESHDSEIPEVLDPKANPVTSPSSSPAAAAFSDTDVESKESGSVSHVSGLLDEEPERPDVSNTEQLTATSQPAVVSASSEDILDKPSGFNEHVSVDSIPSSLQWSGDDDDEERELVIDESLSTSQPAESDVQSVIENMGPPAVPKKRVSVLDKRLLKFQSRPEESEKRSRAITRDAILEQIAHGMDSQPAAHDTDVEENMRDAILQLRDDGVFGTSGADLMPEANRLRLAAGERSGKFIPIETEPLQPPTQSQKPKPGAKPLKWKSLKELEDIAARDAAYTAFVQQQREKEKERIMALVQQQLAERPNTVYSVADDGTAIWVWGRPSNPPRFPTPSPTDDQLLRPHTVTWESHGNFIFKNSWLQFQKYAIDSQVRQQHHDYRRVTVFEGFPIMSRKDSRLKIFGLRYVEKAPSFRGIKHSESSDNLRSPGFICAYCDADLDPKSRISHLKKCPMLPHGEIRLRELGDENAQTKPAPKRRGRKPKVTKTGDDSVIANETEDPLPGTSSSFIPQPQPGTSQQQPLRQSNRDRFELVYLKVDLCPKFTWMKPTNPIVSCFMCCTRIIDRIEAIQYHFDHTCTGLVKQLTSNFNLKVETGGVEERGEAISLPSGEQADDITDVIQIDVQDAAASADGEGRKKGRVAINSEYKALSCFVGLGGRCEKLSFLSDETSLLNVQEVQDAVSKGLEAHKRANPPTYGIESVAKVPRPAGKSRRTGKPVGPKRSTRSNSEVSVVNVEPLKKKPRLSRSSSPNVGNVLGSSSKSTPRAGKAKGSKTGKGNKQRKRILEMSDDSSAEEVDAFVFDENDFE